MSRSAQLGFTLIELMIVLVILAAVVTLGVNRIDNKNNEMKSAVRKLSVLSKELKTAAKLQGATFRLAIDLGKAGIKKKEQQFWVEKSTSQVLVPKDEETPLEPDKKDDDAPPPAFARDDKILKGLKELPGFLEFTEVELARNSTKATDGLVYIYYFPHGLNDEAAIHLRAGEKLNWTLLIHPLTGKATIAPTSVQLQEVQGQ